jgi:hypothetical protein
MSMRNRALATLAGACLVSLAVAGAAAASATPGQDAAPPGKQLPIAVDHGTGRPPIPGYTVVSSDQLTSPQGRQVRGTVTCPVGKVPLGGGVVVASTNVGANVNSSFPSPSGWVADVNNASPADTTFRVVAICAKQPRHYSIQASNIVDNPANTQSLAVALCPLGSLPLGGGAVSTSTSLFVNINTTQPFGNEWKVFENNASTPEVDAEMQAFAICGKLPGYNVQVGPPAQNPPVTQIGVEVSCPAGTLPTGGGMISDFSNVGVNLNTSAPDGSTWVSFEDNSSAFTPSALATVVCAGA